MFCENCGAKLQDNQAFCSECGAAVNAPSPQINTNIQPEMPYNTPVKPKKTIPRKVIVIICIIAAIAALFIAWFPIKGLIEDNMSEKAEEAFLNTVYQGPGHYVAIGEALETVARKHGYDLNVYATSFIGHDDSTIHVHMNNRSVSVSGKEYVPIEGITTFDIPKYSTFYDLSLEFEYDQKNNQIKKILDYSPYGYVWYYTSDKYGMITISSPEVMNYFIDLIYESAGNE